MKLKNLSLLLILLLLLTSCNKNSGNKGIDLKLSILPEVVTDALYIKMNYQLNFTEKFSASQLDKDYKMFVHFWRVKSKDMLLQDDHVPAKPIKQWKSAQPVTYSRTVFIPKFLDEYDIDFEGFEQVKVTIGLYKAGDEKNKIILHQKIVKVQPESSRAPEKVHDEGWNQEETDLKVKNPARRTWRWTKKKAVCLYENPKKESLLIISGGVDKNIFADQNVIFKINDTVLEKFVPKNAEFSKRYIISPEMMGSGDEFRLTIETDKTFIPSALNKEVNDDRELGVQIFQLYFREHVK